MGKNTKQTRSAKADKKPRVTKPSVTKPRVTKPSVTKPRVTKKPKKVAFKLNMDGFDGAISRLWWVMAKYGTKTSDGDPDDHMYESKTWEHGNFLVDYNLTNQVEAF